MILLNIFTYLTVLLFLFKILSRAIGIALSPIHLRWELYPIPHEKGKAKYGGSRLEEVDWWEKPIKKDFIGEWIYMAKEIIFLHGVRIHNKKLWWGSFPFHFALYLYAFNTILIFLGAVLSLNFINISIEKNGIGGFINYISVIIGWILSITGIIGTIILLFRRIFDKNLSLYSTASHYFNILLIGSVYISALVWLISDDNFFIHASNYFVALISFNVIEKLPAAGLIHIIISLAFILYLPFTHMTHFFTKYFTYHSVRWDDAPNVPGSDIANEVSKYLNYPVTWAAPHIGADGSKTWLAIASELPGKEVKNVN